jgi:phosphoenolpyruvate-protein phosphotransferase (PTS system enzyme I)
MHGRAGIGLMRTEYLFLGDQLPDEDTQYRAYRAACAHGGSTGHHSHARCRRRQATAALAITQGPNPALGLRGLRLSLSVTDLFRQQMRAILRASIEGPVRILLPMITGADEIKQARS